MSKRILSLMLCFVMVMSTFVVLPSSVTAEVVANTIVLAADKTTAEPGETITYTLTANEITVTSLMVEMNVPAGLTYVSGSAIDKSEIGWDDLSWTDQNKPSVMLSGYGDIYEETGSKVLATFTCTVDENATGDFEIEVTAYDVFDENDEEMEDAVINNSKITVDATVGATEIFFAGVTLNEETPYVIASTAANTEVRIKASSTTTVGANEKLLATFDAETATLTYNSGYELYKFSQNFVVNGATQNNKESAEYETSWHTYAIMQKMPDTSNKYGIYADGNLTIDLNGYNNGFWLDWNNHIKDVNVRGIEVLGDLTIKGNGYLRIAANAAVDSSGNKAYDTYGIRAEGDINFDSGLVYVYDCLWDQNISKVSGTTLVSAGGNINLNGGSVKMRGVKGRTYIKKFNKTPIYNADNYIVSQDSNLEFAETTDVGMTLGFTREMVSNYGNTNNVSYRAKKTVSFEVDGGTPVESISTTDHTLIDLSNYTTSMEGRLFKFWALDAEGTMPVEEELIVSGNTTLYAIWDIVATLTFAVNDGDAMEDLVLVEGSEVDLAEYVPTRAGYIFEGWYTEAEFENKVTSITLDENKTIYAKWRLATENYTVTFNVNGGSAIAAETKIEGTIIDLSEYTTIKADLVFGGWYTEDTYTNKVETLTLKENITLYAKWLSKYTVTFATGDGASVIAPATKVEGSVLDLNADDYKPTKANSVFDGWYKEATYINKVETITVESDVTLYAKWLEKYTVTFVTGEGASTITGVTTVEGSVLDLTANNYKPTKAGFVFGGWYKEATYINKVETLTLEGNITLYARWLSNYTITFVTGSGASTIPAITKLEDTVIDLTVGTYIPTKAGYAFCGWYEEETFTTLITSIKVAGPKTVYAKFEEATENFTLTFDTDGGNEITPVEVLEGTKVDLLEYVPTRGIDTFLGWCSDEELTNVISSVVILADTTIYAKWKKNYGTYEKIEEKPAPVPGTTPATVVWYVNAKLTNETPYLYGTSAGNKPLSVLSSDSKVAPEGYSLLATFKDGVLTYVRGFDPGLGWNTYVDFMEVPELSTEKIYGIHANGDLVIEMGMNNHFFYSNTIKGYSLPMEGIHVDGNLTINGEATLKLSVNPAMGGSGKQSYGIWAKGNVYINSTTIYAYSALLDYEQSTIKNNYLTFIKAEKVVLNYGNIRFLGRHQVASPGIKKYEAYIQVLQDGYNWYDLPKVNIIEPRALGDTLENVNDPNWNNENNLALMAPTRNQVLFGTALLNSETPYAIPSNRIAGVSSFTASADPSGAVAEYDAVNNVLTITKSITIDGQRSIYKVDRDIEPQSPDYAIFPYTAIEARHDLNIVIPKYVDVVLTSRPFGDNGLSRPIYSPGNITISGEGTLTAYSNTAWQYMTRDKDNNMVYHYASAPIWAHGKLTIGGITANLVTNLDEENGKSGTAIHGGRGVEIKDYASVYASTKHGKLINTVPAIYDGATIMVAEEGVASSAFPGATSQIIPYNAETVLGMKYIQISPSPLEILSISNLDENEEIKVTDPTITFNFNVLLDENSVPGNVFVNGTVVAVEDISVNGKTITIDLNSVLPGSICKVEFKKIKNEAGISFSDAVEFKVSSGLDIGDVKLNGNTTGAPKAGVNTVSVSVDIASGLTSNILVVAAVYDTNTINGEEVKVRRMFLSDERTISTSTEIVINNLRAEVGDVIEVFIWNNENDMRPIKKTVVFGN